MGTRGPTPASIPELKIRGTFRADRHAKRLDPRLFDGVPERPADLKGHALKFWNASVPELAKAGIVARIDSSLLASCCRAYARLRAAETAASKRPLDGNVRRTVMGYLQTFLQIAGQCGLTPTGRARMPRATPAPELPKGITGFARKRSSSDAS